MQISLFYLYRSLLAPLVGWVLLAAPLSLIVWLRRLVVAQGRQRLPRQIPQGAAAQGQFLLGEMGLRALLGRQDRQAARQEE